MKFRWILFYFVNNSALRKLSLINVKGYEIHEINFYTLPYEICSHISVKNTAFDTQHTYLQSHLSEKSPIFAEIFYKVDKILMNTPEHTMVEYTLFEAHIAAFHLVPLLVCGSLWKIPKLGYLQVKVGAKLLRKTMRVCRVASKQAASHKNVSISKKSAILIQLS